MTTPAERQRERRRRKRDGAMLVTVEVRPAARAVLSDARWLGEWDEDNPEAVREVLQKLVDGMKVDRPGE